MFIRMRNPKSPESLMLTWILLLTLLPTFWPERPRWMCRRPPTANTLTLDTNGLTIESVTDQAGKALVWSLGALDKVLGAPLRIELGKSARVIVRYRTSPDRQPCSGSRPRRRQGRSNLTCQPE